MRITFTKRVGVTAAALALAATGAGCQQQVNTTTTTTTTTSSGSASGAPSSGGTTANSLASTDWNRVDAAQVKEGGTLTLPITQLPDNWNSGQADGALADLTDVRDPMGYNNFLRLDETGKATLNPDYVESATVKSQDPQVISVKFNSKAKWEDGKPITIADLAAYVKALSGADAAYQIASDQGWKDIASVTKTTDDFTGEITFKNKTVDWIQYIYPDLPASISSDAKKFNEGYVKTPTPSYGPYKVKSVDTTGQVITLERNPQWWGTKPKLDTIVWKVVSQANLPQAFSNKEIDAIRDIVTGDSYQAAQARTDAKMEKTNGLTWTHVTMNATRGALADVNVRKAAALAINRPIIGEVVVGPLEAPVTLVNNAVFMPGQNGYEDSYGGQLTYDPAKAEQTLKDAGYAKGSDGVYAKDGKSLTLSIVVPADAKSNINRATQISKDLNAVGFKVDLKTVPSDQYFKEYVNKKNFDLVTFSWVGTAFPIASAANLFYPVDSAQNYTGFANPKIGELDKAAQAEFDPTKRIADANEMSKVMLGDYTIVPFYATPKVWAVNKAVANYGASQFESFDWTKIGFTS